MFLIHAMSPAAAQTQRQRSGPRLYGYRILFRSANLRNQTNAWRWDL